MIFPLTPLRSISKSVKKVQLLTFEKDESKRFSVQLFCNFNPFGKFAFKDFLRNASFETHWIVCLEKDYNKHVVENREPYQPATHSSFILR